MGKQICLEKEMYCFKVIDGGSYLLKYYARLHDKNFQ